MVLTPRGRIVDIRNIDMFDNKRNHTRPQWVTPKPSPYEPPGTWKMCNLMPGMF